jgi:hypothetical protein
LWSHPKKKRKRSCQHRKTIKNIKSAAVVDDQIGKKIEYAARALFTGNNQTPGRIQVPRRRKGNQLVLVQLRFMLESN